jgi:predicted dehydrogenase
MAREYVKALRVLGIGEIDVLSRSEASAQALKQECRLGQAFFGGRDSLPQIARAYDGVIVASPAETLMLYLNDLATIGVRKVLIEKPVALRVEELDMFFANHGSFPGMVALNRLFFPSIATLHQLLQDEPVRSADFSFTEWIHRMDPSQYAPEVLAKWGAANCIHVIATAFDLIGMPRTLSAQRGGTVEIPWHPAGSIFTGSGVSDTGALFSYSSDWGSAGRWSITARTSRGSYHLEPMESLSFCPKGSVTREVVVAPWAGETKCGFTEMLQHWLQSESPDQRYSLSRLRRHLNAVDAILYGGALS